MDAMAEAQCEALIFTSTAIGFGHFFDLNFEFVSARPGANRW